MKRDQILLGLGVIVLVGLILLTAWHGLGLKTWRGAQPARPLEELGKFGSAPHFSLLERSGEAINLSELQGQIWVVDFIYTNCQDTCPLQSAEMARLQKELSGGKNLRLVSITVDPARDTPQVLSGYADRFQAHPDRWLFLTGDKKKIYRLAQEGFRLSAVPAPSAEDITDRPVIHSSRFVLVDSSAQIRGYYDSREADALRRLKRDIGSLRPATN